MIRPPRIRPFRAAVLAAVAAVGANGCDDPFAVFLDDVPLTPTETVLFDYLTAPLEDPPAFDLVFAVTARVDQTSNWDFLFRIQDGVPQLAPFTFATDEVSDAGLQLSEERFDEILEAPTEGYVLAEPLAVSPGDVIVARSRVDPTQFLSCSRFAKLQVIDIDVEAATLTFQHLVNPNCGDTVLEPGEHGSL